MTEYIEQAFAWIGISMLTLAACTSPPADRHGMRYGIIEKIEVVSTDGPREVVRVVPTGDATTAAPAGAAYQFQVLMNDDTRQTFVQDANPRDLRVGDSVHVANGLLARRSGSR